VEDFGDESLLDGCFLWVLLGGLDGGMEDGGWVRVGCRIL